jgi:hypothetical protein
MRPSTSTPATVTRTGSSTRADSLTSRTALGCGSVFQLELQLLESRCRRSFHRVIVQTSGGFAQQNGALVFGVIAGRKGCDESWRCFPDAIRVLEASGIAVNLGGNGHNPGRNLLIPSVQTRPKGRSHQHRYRHERTDQDVGRVPHPPTRGWQSTPSTRPSYFDSRTVRAPRRSPEQQRCHIGRSGRRKSAANLPA